MFYNDNDNKDKPGFNAQAFKHAIGMIESSGGKHLSNSASSAAGKYHFLYNSIKAASTSFVALSIALKCSVW